MERRYGYCCINLSLAKEKISTNRGMVKKTFLEKGIAYASELALKNVLDLRQILEWNDDNNIRMFRMSSDIFPWCSEYEISDLPDYQAILEILKSCGDFAKRTDQRITFHPSPYGVLASVNPSVVTKAIKELNQHGEIFDLMGLDRNLFYPINIHVNTTQPSKEEAAERFCLNFQRLSDSVKKRLVVEVDDKKSQYTSVDLFHLIYKPLGIPITFDYLHNRCNPSQYSEEEALALCLSTWPEKIPAITHYSDSKKLYEDESSKEVAHTDWVWGKVETYGLNFDIEFEVKMKDLALLKFLEENKKSLNYEREYTEL
jgi:UV DNA damage endonuclease